MNASPQTVLVVDDDPVFGEVLGRALVRRGFQVHIAQSAAMALTTMENQRAELVVLDLRLAEENGLTLIPQICALAPGVRIVVLTGYASITTAVEAIKLGAHHYLTKPADIEALLNAFQHQPGLHPVPLEAQPTPLDRLEWEHIQRALQEAQGNVSVAAARLGLHRRTLQRKLKKRPTGMN